MRGRDLARGTLAKRLFVFSGDILEKLIHTEAGAYKEVELLLISICSGSYQSLRIAEGFTLVEIVIL